MRVLTIVDLQEEFDGFANKRRVLSCVSDLVKGGAYDYIVNLRYKGGQFGHDKPTENIPEIKKLLKKQKNVINVVKDDDDGSYEMFKALGKFKKKDLKIDMVGVNLPYCICSTAKGLSQRGIPAKNIRIHARGCSEQPTPKHKNDRVDALVWMKKKFKLIK
jgi:anion-transporting  ArsA/GET3 family ATPase